MPETQRDLYEVLGVSRDATADQIKHAYRAKVRECHPDTHPNEPDAERKYKEVNAAFSVLGDQEKRARYDQFGTTDDAPGGSPFGGMGAEDIFDIFGSMFGGGSPFGGRRANPNAPQRGADLQMVLSISLEEAATGVVRKVTIPRWEPCDHCHGTGSEPGHDPRECPTCHGTGQVRRRVQTIFGYQESISVCPTCSGRGKIVEKPCKECGGEGRIHRRREQEIKIQPGVDTGTRVRVPGAGEMGVNGGSPGDLYIVMEVRDDPVFQRDGMDLHRTVSIPWPQAVMGGTSTIGTLIDGDAEFEISEGTEPGCTIRIRGKGMPSLRGSSRGDLILHVTVDVPKPSALSENAARLVSELAKELGADTEKEGLLDKLFGGKKKTDSKKKSAKKK